MYKGQDTLCCGKKFLQHFFVTALGLSCNSRSQTLASYYNDNVQLHQQMAREMEQLYNLQKTELILKENTALNQLVFMYLPKGSNRFEAIYIDRSFRMTPSPDNLEQFNFQIPSTLVKSLSGSIYHAIKTESTGVFFAYEFYSSISEHEIGVFTPFDTSKVIEDNVIRKLPNNYYIYKSIAP